MSKPLPANGQSGLASPTQPRSLWAAWKAWLATWRQGAAAGLGAPERWVLVDVETTGLDVDRDELLAIAAVGLEVDWATGRLLMRPGDSLALDLKPVQVSGKDNILLHGIGAGRQKQGLPPEQALPAFLDWVGGAQLVAFHAAFDKALLNRACQRHLGQPVRSDWLDIAPLCVVSHPEVRAESLDEWMHHFGISCHARHEATADVLAEAELLQRIWPRVAAECRSWADVRRYAAQEAWIARR
jgi:DNA polymerase-3 subunit epsilon